MPIRNILILYALSWVLALMGNAAVELARLRSERGVAAWVDHSGFALTVWLVLPILPLVAMVVSLQRREWLVAMLKGHRAVFKAPQALAVDRRG